MASIAKNRETQEQKLNFPNHKIEIALHILNVVIHQYLITKLVIDYAQQHPQSESSQSYLTPYIGKNRDSHDIQWETYRSNLPVLALCITVWYIVSPHIEKYRNQKSWLLGGIILAYSFRSDFLLYCLLLTAWYLYTVVFYKRSYFVASCWLICIAILYINQLTNHFEFLSQSFGQLIPMGLSSQHRQISFGQVLNMTFLKLISFSIDRQRGSQLRELQKHRQKCKECTQKQFCLKGRSLMDTDDFSLKSYMNYLLFAPTLLTGPPLSYKNFISFKSMTTTKKPQITKFIFLLISFQLYQHFCPVIELTSDQSFVQAQVMALFHLVFIWFKFLIIWKVARLWAAACGIEVIDNLSRCVCNNYGFQGFWRMWHRGFNQWLVRYLYVPLGGNTNIISVIATVAFVAFWHDHTINIVIWALALIIFILPQILIKKYFKNKQRHLFKFYWFKYLSALASAAYIYLLVFSNIIGFGYGWSQMNLIWSKVQQQWVQLIWSIAVLVSAVILMFYQREVEQGDKNY